MYNLGVIGSGSRMTELVRKMIAYPDIKLQAVADPRVDAMKANYNDVDGIAFYETAEEMLANEKLDCIAIGTRCDTHTKYALMAAKLNVPIFLEKPVSITDEQLEELKALMPMSDRVVVSFPLRYSVIVEKVKEIIDRGTIGSVQHVQAVNNVPYAGGYYHKWYRDEGITGGLFLQKSTHDLDYINYVLGNVKPIKLCAMNSKTVFKGDMPEGQRCFDCPHKDECPDNWSDKTPTDNGYRINDYCCFAKDTGNEDSGSCIVMYENGVHAVYSQDFIARKGAGKRGARFIGYKGTLEFDFYTGIIKVIHHHEDIVEELKFVSSGGHHGGDKILVQNFIDVIRGNAKSCATLESGILSAKMCLAAKSSAKNFMFYDI